MISQLEAIARDDQRYRNDSLRQTTTSQQEDDDNMAKQDVLDRHNLIKIERIIARYGYPGRSLVGSSDNRLRLSSFSIVSWRRKKNIYRFLAKRSPKVN